MGNVKRAGDLLSSLFSGQFDSMSLEKGRVSAKLFTTWADIALELKIPAAGDHSRIGELDHGILSIEAEHPGWVQLLQTKQVQILRLLQKRFPELEIRGISFSLSRETISRPSVGAADVSAEPHPSAPAAGSGQPSPDGNDDLYEPIKQFKKIIQKKNRQTS